VRLTDLVSLPFWFVVGVGLALAANLSSLAQQSSLVAARAAARARWLQSDDWDRTPTAIRWYGLGLAWAGLYAAGVLLGIRWLAGIGLVASLVTFAVSMLERRRTGRPAAGWIERLRLWQLGGWAVPFLVGAVGVLAASWLSVK
jgi:hypothetical protein